MMTGKSTLGLLNPLLYSVLDDKHPSVFNDITDGHNPGCGSAGFFAQVQYASTESAPVAASHLWELTLFENSPRRVGMLSPVLDLQTLGGLPRLYSLFLSKMARRHVGEVQVVLHDEGS